MRKYAIGRLELGAQLTLIFLLLVGFILGGNGLLIWQFRMARQQTVRLAVVSRQTVAILRLQNSLASFHQGLDLLIASADARVLSDGTGRLQLELLDQVRQTREALSLSPSVDQIDKRFLPILDAVEIGFPHQLSAVCALAAKGDWDAVKDRAAHQLAPTEGEVARIARDSDVAFTNELASTEQDSLRLQDRILFLIPFFALSTFLMAALFVWVIAQRILEVKLEGRLNERMRITRDLHDTFLQTIQGSKLYAEHALAKSSDLQSMRESIGQLVCWLERATDEGRSALNSLRTTENDLYELGDALQAIAVDARAQGPMKVVLSISGSPINLLPEVQEQVLRIAGEAIANARKHSKASQTEVKLEYAGQISLTVSDNGRGFHLTSNPPPANARYGLRTMRERALQIGGKLTISSSPGSGTQVTLILPKRSLSRAVR